MVLTSKATTSEILGMIDERVKNLDTTSVIVQLWHSIVLYPCVLLCDLTEMMMSLISYFPERF